VVTCHLGAGASLAEVAFGHSVDTTMGFTPLEGLVMATRSGSVDPGALLWLQRSARISPEEMERVLEEESGLLALCGTADMRDVVARSEEADRSARLAIDVYVHRLRGSIAGMAASMEGVDAISFTGGVGEGSARIRSEACGGLGFLGVEVDGAKNQVTGAEDADLSLAALPCGWSWCMPGKISRSLGRCPASQRDEGGDSLLRSAGVPSFVPGS
jgi:acetate kinase